MKIYLVGGAVRDQLLGLPVKEHDFVVVGATPEEMIKKGYKPVGKDFPVFLHPKTHEEYALARTERKISRGYTGFEFYAAPNVTLKNDLKRRDLTINAIAKTQAGKLIDPYGGRKDLKNKVLRHVSPAFAEDPVRILRVGRFAARFGDFTVHPETIKLMRKMVKAGEADALVPERVWQELEKTLNLAYPGKFFEILKTCNALKILFPEISACFSKTMKALTKAAIITENSKIRFSVLTGLLDQKQIKVLCARIKIPKKYKELALLTNKYQTDFHNALKLTANRLLLFLEHTDAFRRPKRFADLLLGCEIGSKKIPSQQIEKLRKAYNIAKKITANQLDSSFKGKEINKQLHFKRRRAIKENFGSLSIIKQKLQHE